MDASALQDTDWWQRHENTVTGGEPLQCDLHVRCLGAGAVAHERRSAIVQRLERLDRRDAIDDATVEVWGASICVSECCSGNEAVRSVRDRIERYRQWAGEKGHVSLALSRREIDSSITGECYEVVDLPTMCLAVRRSDRIEAVLPVTIGGEEWTIDTYLDWFERTRERGTARVVADA